MSQPAEARPKKDRVEGAIGLVLRHGAAYAGSSDAKVKPSIAGFLRWGRLTVSGAGGFTTRRKDDVERGLSAELVRRPTVRIGLGLRVASGRSESDSPQLAGLGDIKDTLRTHLRLRWTPEPGWQLSLNLSNDTLNRGGGYFVTGGISRSWTLDARQRLIASFNLTGAGDRFMQTWHGVTAEQSVASGYPEYHPAEGLRDAELALTWRVEISDRWAGFVGIAHSELLEGARRSPFTFDPSSDTLSAGLAWRF